MSQPRSARPAAPLKTACCVSARDNRLFTGPFLLPYRHGGGGTYLVCKAPERVLPIYLAKKHTRKTTTAWLELPLHLRAGNTNTAIQNANTN